MAGIKARQHTIFKIGTRHLKKHGWDLRITREEAFKMDELIKLFDSQMFRLITKILNRDDVDFTKYVLSVVVDDKKDFKRLVKGVKVNGITFKRFVGTTGGLKGNCVIFVNENILDELNARSTSITNKIKIVVAKYEAYKSLTCSASQEIISPNGILVVKDCVTKFRDTVINLDDSNKDIKEPVMTLMENIELENTVSDGFNLCTIEYMEKVCAKLGIDYVSGGVCLRNKWLKGMMYPFPIKEFMEKYNGGNYIVKDIWGNEQDLRNVELILTESSLKLWSAYSSIEDYIENYKESGYEFAVTKISPDKLEDYRELNYQYLQSYDFTQEDIEELCAPTINYLKNSMGSDYESVIKFLGVSEKSDDSTWQKALYRNKYMLNDPYIIDSIHRMIKKKISNAKIGKLICEGNYQISSGDPFALMQSICGLEVTGLLKAEECYSSYWCDRDIEEILAFRSPMTSHNNIRKCKVVNNEDVRYWYQYMYNIFIINSFDTFCMAENGEDFDSDTNYTTNNKVLLRRHIKLPAIQCVQRNAVKVKVTEKKLEKSNYCAFGNNVGSMTNNVTGMKEVQSRFPVGSREYNILEYRMACGQLYQQNCLDKIKGIIARPMPNYWYNRGSCNGNEELLKLCANKKPYFMIYRYPQIKKDLDKYVLENNMKCFRYFSMSLNELLSKDDKNEEELEFIKWYYEKLPVGIGNCAMNNICFYVESQLDGHKALLKTNSEFDYSVLKYNRRSLKIHRENLANLCEEYIHKIANFKSSVVIEELEVDEIAFSREQLKEWFKEKAKEICPSDEERLNIILDLCYGNNKNKQFCWDCVGDLINKRLEELNGQDNIK